MGLDLDNGLVQIKVTQSVCGFVAICMTLSRLYIRRGRYWWDDVWTFFSLIIMFIQFAGTFVHVSNSTLPKTSRVAAYYLIATTFYIIIWSARLSILSSIIRIDPDPKMHTRLKWVAAIFTLCIIFFIAQLMWVCEPDKGGWKLTSSPQCELGKQVAICQIVTDIISDIILIVLPLRLFRDLRDKGLRRRLMLIFSTSIATSVVSLVHAAYIIKVGGPKVVMIAIIENTMSLTVANFPAVAAALFKVFGVCHDPNHNCNISTITFSGVVAEDRENDKAGGEGMSFSFPNGVVSLGLKSWVSALVSGGTRSWSGDEAKVGKTVDVEGELSMKSLVIGGTFVGIHAKRVEDENGREPEAGDINPASGKVDSEGLDFRS